ncbi:hypothetical protein AK812_SmicGene16359 [Symbiodinium microadriaticum]|uniref:Uncharacterized protein n=1 Tax=Symbiodinium microadriaticum TaxID=2951 RepID=A0A1Q9E0H6_SYMMI|nr:hypothetical protein AK812_SmicGene16359 [Symbiodinium microadriaticum]
MSRRQRAIGEEDKEEEEEEEEEEIGPTRKVQRHQSLNTLLYRLRQLYCALRLDARNLQQNTKKIRWKYKL